MPHAPSPGRPRLRSAALDTSLDTTLDTTDARALAALHRELLAAPNRADAPEEPLRVDADPSGHPLCLVVVPPPTA